MLIFGVIANNYRGLDGPKKQHPNEKIVYGPFFPT